MHANIQTSFIDPEKDQKLHVINLHIEDYDEVLELQKKLFKKLLAHYHTSVDNYLILCQHNPVFTVGKNGNMGNLLDLHSDVPIRRIHRGGDITFHGHGQLVGYPILNLNRFNLGLKAYVKLLEDTVIDLLKEYSIESTRSDDEIGVWLSANKKICAIGIKSSRYITMHGFALNVNTNLSYFQKINPCGIKDKKVTSMEEVLQHKIDFEEVEQKFLTNFLKRLSANFIPLYDNITPQ